MPRQKKDGVKISLFLKKDLVDAIRKDATEKGQSLTTAIEFAMKHYLYKDVNNPKSKENSTV